MAFLSSARDVPVVQSCDQVNCHECNTKGTYCGSSVIQISGKVNGDQNLPPSTSASVVIRTCVPGTNAGHAFQPVSGNIPVGILPLTTGPSLSVPFAIGRRTRKKSPQPIPKESRDEAYYERRKRNNESAKRSRELRRYKEQQTSYRVGQLERENLQLKAEITVMKNELDKLRNILYRTPATSAS